MPLRREYGTYQNFQYVVVMKETFTLFVTFLQHIWSKRKNCTYKNKTATITHLSERQYQLQGLNVCIILLWWWLHIHIKKKQQKGIFSNECFFLTSLLLKQNQTLLFRFWNKIPFRIEPKLAGLWNRSQNRPTDYVFLNFFDAYSTFSSKNFQNHSPHERIFFQIQIIKSFE